VAYGNESDLRSGFISRAAVGTQLFAMPFLFFLEAAFRSGKKRGAWAYSA
jgi:hypothetical protein